MRHIYLETELELDYCSVTIAATFNYHPGEPADYREIGYSRGTPATPPEACLSEYEILEFDIAGETYTLDSHKGLAELVTLLTADYVERKQDLLESQALEEFGGDV